MRADVTTWTVLLMMCTIAAARPSYYGQNDKFVEVHKMISNELSKLDYLPPLDPAVHGFPTVPTVPLLPTCTKEGYFRDPFNCGKFYYCHYSQAVPIAYYCQYGLIFNTITDTCEDPHNVQC